MATLGGTTIADPEAGTRGHEQSAIDVGGLRETFTGAMFAWHVGTRRQFKLSWKGLTAAQVAVLWGLYQTRASMAWKPTEGGTYTVIVVPGSWRRRDQPGQAGLWYEAEMTLMEVAAS
jgi:hypothetical protein